MFLNLTNTFTFIRSGFPCFKVTPSFESRNKSSALLLENEKLLFPLSNTNHTLTRRKTQFGSLPHSTQHFLVLQSPTVRIGSSVPCLTFLVITKQAWQTGHLYNIATPMLSLLCFVSSLQFYQISFL